MKALAALPQFVAGTNLRAWTFTILRNTFYEQSRRRRTERAAIAQGFADDEAGSPAQDAQLEFRDLQRHIYALPPLLREALVLVGAQGLSYEEAAAICAVPEGTIKARVSRARRQLAQMHAVPSDPQVS